MIHDLFFEADDNIGTCILIISKQLTMCGMNFGKMFFSRFYG